MRGSEPYYPVNTEAVPKADDRGFSNTCIGGVTIREEVALRILQGLLSNPVFLSAAGNDLRSGIATSFSAADFFVSQMGVSKEARELQC